MYEKRSMYDMIDPLLIKKIHKEGHNQDGKNWLRVFILFFSPL